MFVAKLDTVLKDTKHYVANSVMWLLVLPGSSVGTSGKLTSCAGSFVGTDGNSIAWTIIKTISTTCYDHTRSPLSPTTIFLPL